MVVIMHRQTGTIPRDRFSPNVAGSRGTWRRVAFVTELALPFWYFNSAFSHTLCLLNPLQTPERQILVGICAMTKKSNSKAMTQILERLCMFDYINVVIFPEETILEEPVESWPLCDCLISFHSKGEPRCRGFCCCCSWDHPNLHLGNCMFGKWFL